MKKIFTVLTIILSAASAFAQDAPKESPFVFSGSAYAYGLTYQTTTKDATTSYSALRFRPYLGYKSGNVDAALKLEIDQVLGGGKAGQADVGNDEKSIIEVKAAYLSYMLPFLPGLSVKGGADEYKTVGGFTCGTELGLGIVNFKNDMVNFTLGSAKLWQPSVTYVKDDPTTEKTTADFYIADATITVNESLKVRPAIYAIAVAKNAQATSTADQKIPVPFANKTAYVPSLGISFKADALSLDINGAYGSCAKDDNDVKYSGYAIDVNPSYKVSDQITVGAYLTTLSGDKDTSTDKNESFKSFTLKQDGWGRAYILEGSYTFNNLSAKDNGFADVRGKSNGYMLAGANVAYNANPVTVKASVNWAQLDKVASGTKKDLGIEIDGQISYEVQKNSSLIIEGAYLASGKAFGEEGALGTAGVKKQNAIYTAVGLSSKF